MTVGATTTGFCLGDGGADWPTAYEFLGYPHRPARPALPQPEQPVTLTKQHRLRSTAATTTRITTGIYSMALRVNGRRHPTTGFEVVQQSATVPLRRPRLRRQGPGPRAGRRRCRRWWLETRRPVWSCAGPIPRSGQDPCRWPVVLDGIAGWFPPNGPCRLRCGCSAWSPRAPSEREGGAGISRGSLRLSAVNQGVRVPLW